MNKQQSTASATNNQISQNAFDKFVAENPVVQGMDENARVGFYLEAQQNAAKPSTYGKRKKQS